jgi:hypothetical protein
MYMEGPASRATRLSLRTCRLGEIVGVRVVRNWSYTLKGH